MDKIILRFGMPLVIHSDQGIRKWSDEIVVHLTGLRQDTNSALSSGVRWNGGEVQPDVFDDVVHVFQRPA